MINLSRISQAHLETEPYRWAVIDDLFSPRDAVALAKTFPHDRFKRMSYYGGDKDSDYESRALIGMREQFISGPEKLSRPWKALANDFLSPDYRAAMSSLTGFDLSAAPLEVNVFHYPPGGLLGAHPDLNDKIVTHVFYFNRSWNNDDGGYLTILRSSDPADVVTTISPIVGNSVVLVRSDNSWHTVTPVAKSCRLSRRSLTATFYRPEAVSTMWPPGDTTPLHCYPNSRAGRWWGNLTTRWRSGFKNGASSVRGVIIRHATLTHSVRPAFGFEGREKHRRHISHRATEHRDIRRWWDGRCRINSA